MSGVWKEEKEKRDFTPLESNLEREKVLKQDISLLTTKIQKRKLHGFWGVVGGRGGNDVRNVQEVGTVRKNTSERRSRARVRIGDTE